MYEDVTVDVQPDPDRHLTQGWIYGFGDGPGGYPQEWTAAKSSNWHAFLDPNEEWEPDDLPQQLRGRPPGRAVPEERQAGPRLRRLELGLARRSSNATSAPGCTPRTVWRCTSSRRSSGPAPTNMINTAVAVNAAHKMRFAQDLALFNLDLSEAGDRLRRQRAPRGLAGGARSGSRPARSSSS